MRSTANGGVWRPAYWRILLAGCSATALAAGAAQAQGVAGDPPPVKSAIDENGVDLGRVVFTTITTDVSIGESQFGGLSYSRYFHDKAWRDSVTGTISRSSTIYTVSIGNDTTTFNASSGAFAPQQADGSSLTYDTSSQIYTFTNNRGVIAKFSKAYAEAAPLNANEGKLFQIIEPNGETTTFTYKVVFVGGQPYNRLQSVNNNLGYQIKFEYALATPTSTSHLTAFRQLTKATGINNAIDYCAPSGDSCPLLTQPWPFASYSTPTPTTSVVADALGGTTRYTYDTAGRIVGVKPPNSAADTLSLTYSTAGYVNTVTRNGRLWTYSVVSTMPLVVDVTTPVGFVRQVTTTGGMFTKETVGGLQVGPSYGTAAFNAVSYPEGNIRYNLKDARNNVYSVRIGPKNNPFPSYTVIGSATYDATCTNVVICNQPKTITDASGGVTDYVYDPVHGQVLSAVMPAPSPGAPRPTKTTTYQALYAWYKTGLGPAVQAPTPVYRPIETTICATSASCVGTASEIKSTTDYGASGTANNLLPVGYTRSASDGSLSATTTRSYDAVGNLIGIDGPLPGPADLTTYRYDILRRQIGVLGADPDGAGALKHRAIRIEYDAVGQVAAQEVGTVSALTDVAWAAFSTLHRRDLAYDGDGRLLRETFTAAGVVESITQHSYDANGRLECTAERLNPAAFSTLPSSACTLGPAGPDGADRITKITWNPRNERIKLTIGLGLPLQQDVLTTTYTLNGKVATISDALGGITTFGYDTFDRLASIAYPTATNRTVSSTTDFEAWTYDFAQRVLTERRRDGQTFTNTYDGLGRIVFVDAPPGTPDLTLSYDYLGQLTSRAAGGQTSSFSYDALGRLQSTNGPNGALSYQYDLAGRRTRMSWPDGFFVAYDYDDSGALTALRANGASTGPGVLAKFSYDDRGLRTGISAGNGSSSSFTYDTAARLVGLNIDHPGSAYDQNYTFGYSGARQLLTRAGSNPAYDYSPPAGATSYTANGLNQFTTSGSLTLAYDARGNLTSDGLNTYSYDATNRLLGMSGVALSYDPSGNLGQIVGATTTRFLYDGASLVGEYDGSGALLRRYVHVPGRDEPLVWYEGSTLSNPRWMNADPIGSIVSVSDASGAVLGINTYDEYGNPGATNLGRFSYTGQALVPELGLLNYKARFYSSALGRFLQPDPIGYEGGMNLYGYADNDPVNRTDPTGLSANWVSPLVVVASPGLGCDITMTCLTGDAIVGLANLVRYVTPPTPPGQGGSNPLCLSGATHLIPKGDRLYKNQFNTANPFPGSHIVFGHASMEGIQQQGSQFYRPSQVATAMSAAGYIRGSGQPITLAACGVFYSPLPQALANWARAPVYSSPNFCQIVGDGGEAFLTRETKGFDTDMKWNVTYPDRSLGRVVHGNKRTVTAPGCAQ